MVLVVSLFPFRGIFIIYFAVVVIEISERWRIEQGVASPLSTTYGLANHYETASSAVCKTLDEKIRPIYTGIEMGLFSVYFLICMRF